MDTKIVEGKGGGGSNEAVYTEGAKLFQTLLVIQFYLNARTRGSYELYVSI